MAAQYRLLTTRAGEMKLLIVIPGTQGKDEGGTVEWPIMKGETWNVV